jgi:putative Ca2+/H+ antiporter (TMEM165/GDT1 family)
LDIKTLAIVFGTIFVAELGDKTQLATLLFAADKEVSRWIVFLGASAALVLTSAIGVLAGGLVSQVVSPRHLSIVAGIGFIAIGLWSLWTA